MNFIKRMKLKTFLMFFILVFILVPATVATLFSYCYTRSTIESSYTQNYIESIFAEMKSDINMLLSQFNALSLQLVKDEAFHDYIYNDTLDYKRRKERLSEIFASYIPEDSIISFVDYISPSGEYYRFGSADTTFPFSQTYFDSLSNTAFLIHDTCLQIGEEFYCPIGRNLYNYNKSYRAGSLILYVKQERLGALYSASNSNESIFFLSTNDKIISHPDTKYISSVLYLPQELLSGYGDSSSDRQEYVYFTESVRFESLKNTLTFTALVSNHVLFQTMNTIIRYIFISFLGIGAIALLLSIVVSRNLLHQISALQYRMVKFVDNWQNFQPITPSNEIDALDNSFNKMAKEIKSLIAEIELEKEKQKIAELKALQSQINPHFLYNALGSISWKAKENHQYEIDDMLITLATFYRIGLHKGDDFITISDELQHVESYLEIEAIRFPDLFTVTYDVDETILPCLIPKIILQPLVENSIKHGFKHLKQQMKKNNIQPEKGVIRIRFSRKENLIRFEVKDNGCGVLLEEGTLPSSSDKDSGYGLYNVNERLVHFYGSDYRLHMESTPGKGTCVYGTIPLTKKVAWEPKHPKQPDCT